MQRGTRLAGIFIAVLALAGCAAAGTGSGDGSGGLDAPLEADELASIEDSYTDLYELVNERRPQWLDPRGPVSVRDDPTAQLPVVFVEGSERGLPETLRNIPVTDVGRVEFLTPGEATNRYGAGYPGGVIEVTLRPVD